MPVYIIKEKFWFWDADYFVTNQNGHNMYKLRRHWWAPNQAVVFYDIHDHDSQEMVIRKRLWSPFQTVFELVRHQVLLGELKEARNLLLQHKYVLILDGLEYTVDESRWKSKKMFSFKHRGTEIASVQKRALDLGNSFWVNVQVDTTYYEGDAMREVSLVVLGACLIMIQLLYQQDKHELEKQRKEKVKQMPQQIIRK
jgi:uncharacterized protein YxjI